MLQNRLCKNAKHKKKDNHWFKWTLFFFRYRCLQCFNFDMCQQCFYMGCTKKKHKLKHPIQEYCLSVSPDTKKKFALCTCIYFLLYIHEMSVIWLMNFIISNFQRQQQRWIRKPFWRHCAITSAKSIDRNQGKNTSLLLRRVICFPTQREYAWCCLSHLVLCLVQMEIPLWYSFFINCDNYIDLIQVTCCVFFIHVHVSPQSDCSVDM